MPYYLTEDNTSYALTLLAINICKRDLLYTFIPLPLSCRPPVVSKGGFGTAALREGPRPVPYGPTMRSATGGWLAAGPSPWALGTWIDITLDLAHPERPVAHPEGLCQAPSTQPGFRGICSASPVRALARPPAVPAEPKHSGGSAH